MGWASAGRIFDPIAQSLIDSHATPEMKRTILTALINQLQGEDWDTEDESLNQFRHDIDVVAAFYLNDVGNHFDDGSAEGFIKYGPTRPNIGNPGWRLICLTCATTLNTTEYTITGHNQLINEWVTHDHDQHNGNGNPDFEDWRLIG